MTFAALACLWAAGAATAGGIPGTDLEEVVVVGSGLSLAGNPASASEGVVLAEQLKDRPILRTGESRSSRA